MNFKNLDIAVIEYGAGNLGSVLNFLKTFGFNSIDVIHNRGELKKHKICIIPGVGHFGSTSNNIHSSGIADEIKQFYLDDNLIIGICIGAHLLMTSSEEAPGIKGLDLIEGECVHLRKSSKKIDKIPRVGWEFTNWNTEISEELKLNKHVTSNYFVHSYQLSPKNKSNIIATSKDGICSAIKQKNV